MSLLRRRAPSRSETYRRYMASPEWSARRLRAVRLAGFRCQGRRLFGLVRCWRRRNLQAHHLNYVRLGHELDSDLRALCPRCHRRADDRRRGRERRAADLPWVLAAAVALVALWLLIGHPS